MNPKPSPNYLMSLKSLPFFLAAISMVPAHAAVVLQDSYAAGAAGGAPTDLGGGIFGYEIDVTSSFSAAGRDKLVLVYSGHDGNVAGVPTVTSVTYDGAALTQAVQEPDNLELLTAGIFYLDKVASDGVLRIELASDTTVHYGFGLYAVDGLKPGVQDTGSGRLATELTTTLPVTIGTSEGFFVQEAARNNQSLAGDPGDDYETLYNYSADAYRALSQYQVTSGSGDYVAPINNTGENYRMVVAAGFEAVPEPSSLALMGLGGLLLITRRRRD